MRAARIVFVLALVTAAAGAAYVARPYVDAWRATPPTPSAAVPSGRYQCSMHPQIVADHPDLCPICQMPLQRVDDIAAAPSGPRTPRFYRHPMRPDVTSLHPAKDEMGMDYVPVYDDENAGAALVAGRSSFTLSSERQQLIGVTHAPVQMRRLDSEIRAVGVVAYDPALYQAIVEYRQALAAAQQLGDEALAEAHTGARTIARSAALRLRQLGFSEQQLREIDPRGHDPVDLLLPGKNMWVYAQVYEYEIPSVRAGQSVTIALPSQPQRTYAGRVAAIDPILDAKTRTARVRIQVSGADDALRPEAFVRATIHTTAADVLAVPDSAVLPGGRQQIVFVIRDGGTFEPRAVQLGRQAGGYYEVLDGLRDGEDVVTSANFLIDSESRFRAALAAFSPKAPGDSEPPRADAGS